jgi:hypothetical protein
MDGVDPPYKESYKVSKRFIVSEFNYELEQDRRRNPYKLKKDIVCNLITVDFFSDFEYGTSFHARMKHESKCD